MIGSCIGIGPVPEPSCQNIGSTKPCSTAARRPRTSAATAASPLAAAYAQIEAAFSPSACHARFKERVAALMRSGPTDPEVRMRYRILAERHRAAGLVDAIALVEGLRDGEITARAATARNWGANGRPRLALMILDELRLILRVVRRFMPACFAGILAAVLAAEYAGPA